MKSNKYNYNNQTGMYRNKILLRKRTIVEDELFQQIPDFDDYGTYWSMIKTLKGEEINEVAQEQMNLSKRFVVKYTQSLEEFIQSDKTSFEIVFKGVVYDVKDAVNDNELNESITIVAEGRV